jgi:hypothetical protein
MFLVSAENILQCHKNLRGTYMGQKRHGEHRRETRKHTRVPQALTVHQEGLWPPSGSDRPRSTPIYSHIPQNPQDGTRINFSATASLCSSVIPSGAYFWHSAGRGIDSGGLFINLVALPMMREWSTPDLWVHRQWLDGFFSLSLIFNTMFSSEINPIFLM